jgi:hypothetical protein
MRVSNSHRQNERGAVLPMALFTCLVIGITMAAYLDLASSQHRAVVRSAAWNSAIPVAESGLEEALTHLHLNRTNLSANNWQTAGSGLTLSNGVALGGLQYYQQRNLGDNRYLVAISGAIAPVITSQAYVKAPLTGAEIVRTIQVSTAGGALFARGMVAKGNIEWTGNILSDSFDSQDPTGSTGGRYDLAKRRDSGSVGSVEGTFAMGGGIIYGSANIGPTGTFSLGGGVVGDSAWIGGGNSGIQAGHFSDDLNLSFPDVVAPFTSAVIPPGGFVTNTTYSTNLSPVASLSYPFVYVGLVVTNSVTAVTYPSGTPYPVVTNVTTTGSGRGRGRSASYTTNYTFTQFEYFTNATTTNISSQYYDMVLDSGDYSVLSIPNGSQVLIRGNARLYVAGDVDMQGLSQIQIATAGSLNMYVAGNAKLAGNGVVNHTSDATRFSFWGLPTCTNVELGGNAEFTGTIYAPQAYLHAGGGGSTAYDVVGAAIVGSAKFNGHFLFHYDENLGKNGPRDAFVVTGWAEL